MAEHTAREVVKKLKSLGYVEIHVTGDHHKFKDQNNKTVVVPYSHLGDSIVIGTYKSIMKYVGL